jgi:hypothetical protein
LLPGLLLATFAASSAAAAEPTEESLIREGVEARRKQDDLAALELFKKAHALSHSPRAAAQMGLAEIALGRWTDADAHLEEAIGAAHDPWIQRNRATLEESLARVKREVGKLEVLGSPPGAEVLVGGQVKGTLPLAAPIRVRVGDFRLEVRAPGHEAFTRTVRINPGQLTRETVELVAAKAVASDVPAATDPGAMTANPSVVRIEEPAEAPAADGGRRLRLAGMILSGAGAVSLGVGLTFGLMARSAAEDDANRPTFDRSADSSGHRYETLQWVGYGVGAALLAGGITAYVIGKNRRGSEPGTSLSLLPTSGGAMAAIGGTL